MHDSQLTFTTPLENITYQLQPFNGKSHHVAFALTTPRLHFLRHRFASLSCHSKRHIAWRAIPTRTPRRSSRPALANSICATQCLTRVLCEARDDGGGWAAVGFDRFLSPTAVGDTRFERIESKASTVIGRCTGKGKECCGDQTACCLGVNSSVGNLGFWRVK